MCHVLHETFRCRYIGSYVYYIGYIHAYDIYTSLTRTIPLDITYDVYYTTHTLYSRIGLHYIYHILRMSMNYTPPRLECGEGIYYIDMNNLYYSCKIHLCNISNMITSIYMHSQYSTASADCRVLQCVAGCCSVLQRVAVCCSVL